MKTRIVKVGLDAIACAVLVWPHPMLALVPVARTTEGYDKRTEVRADLQVPVDRLQAAARLRARLPDVRIDYDGVTGSPAWISRMGFLSGSTEDEIHRTGDLGLVEDDPNRAIKAFLVENEALFGYGPEALTNAAVEREFVCQNNGMRTVVWQQRLNDIPVFEATFKGSITRSGRLVNISSRFLVGLERASGLDEPSRVLIASSPPVSAAEAAASAIADLGGTVQLGSLIRVNPTSSTPQGAQKFAYAGWFGEGSAKLIWLPMNPSSLRLCWSIELINRSTMEGFRILVDASSGEPLVRQNRTCWYTPSSYRIFTSDSPSPFTPGHTQPSSGQPASVARQLLALPALSQTASPDGWVPDGSNQTHGNNVDASANRIAQSPNPQPRPQGNPFRVFDFPLNLNNDPSTYGDAAVANLFYWCNWMHDRLYLLGFDEPAGNFQDYNYGRGGLEGDRILAYAQYGADIGLANNSAFYPAPDGTSGVITMYVFNGPAPVRDVDLAAETILHEYTHGLSDRLVDITYSQFERQDAGLSEGWSDFYALSLLSETGDNAGGNYPMGG